LPSDATRKPPPNLLPSDAMKNYYANCQAVDGNCSNKSFFDNAMSKQSSLHHGVFPCESENNYNAVVLDDDMSIVNDMDTNTIPNDVSPEHQVLQNRKRAAIEDSKGIDNSNIVDKVA